MLFLVRSAVLSGATSIRFSDTLPLTVSHDGRTPPAKALARLPEYRAREGDLWQ